MQVLHSLACTTLINNASKQSILFSEVCGTCAKFLASPFILQLTSLNLKQNIVYIKLCIPHSQELQAVEFYLFVCVYHLFFSI